MIEYFILILAIPLGILCAKATQDEKSIYTKYPYFPLFLKIIAIISAITISQDKQIFLTSAFMLITIYVWQKA